jgi:hypothetical protein
VVFTEEKEMIVNIPAAAGTSATLGTYKYLVVRSTTAPFQISFDGNNYRTANANDLFGPVSAHKVWFQPVNGVACTVDFDYGKTEFAAQNTKVSSQPADSYAKSALDGVINAGAVVTLTGVNGADKRKSIAVQNLDAGGNTVTVQDGNGNALAVLQAGWPPWVRESGGIINVKNTSGASLSRVLIDEVFNVT